MNIRNILALAAAAMLSVSCMDGDWDTPNFDTPPYGNNDIQADSLVTFAELIRMYPLSYEAVDIRPMTKEAQVKVYVTGNDIQGNLYTNLAVQDENGQAMIICVYENSMYSYLPVGQELLIETKDLYIGSYGQQPQIGTPLHQRQRFAHLPLAHEQQSVAVALQVAPQQKSNSDQGGERCYPIADAT